MSFRKGHGTHIQDGHMVIAVAVLVLMTLVGGSSRK